MKLKVIYKMYKKSAFIMVMFLVVINAALASPVLSPIGAQTVDENSILSINVTYTAPDNGAISVTSNLSFITFASINNSQATMNIAPGYENSGTHTVNVTAADGNSTSSQTFTLTVNDVNRNPTLQAIPDQSATANFMGSVNLSAYGSDDDGNSLSYSVVSANASRVSCSINGDVLQYTPALSFVGDSTCNVTANDGNGGTASQNVKITSQAQNPDLTISQNPVLPELVMYTDASQRTATFDLVLTESGNMPLTNVEVTLGDFVGTSRNITVTDKITQGISIADGAQYTKSYTVSLPDTNFLEEQYKASVLVKYHGTNKTGELNLKVRPSQSTLTVDSEVLLGGTSQNRNTTTTSTKFTLTNNGDFSLSNFVIESTASSAYNVTFSLDDNNFKSKIDFSANVADKFTLAKGATRDIYVKGFVPKSFTSKKTDIGDITIVSSGETKTVTGFFMQAENKLDIERIKGDSETLSSGEVLDGIDAGETVDFKVKVRNAFSEDIKIKDIEITVTIENIDDSDDLDETSQEFDLKDGDSEEEVFKFFIPYYVEPDTKFNVLIEAEGKDENGGNHYASETVKLEIDKKSDEVSITRAELTSDVLQCVRSTDLDLLVTNTGEDDQDEVKVEVKSSALGINFKQEGISLDGSSKDDGNFRKSISVDLPDSIRPGTYPIEINTYYSRTIPSRSGRVSLTVKACNLDDEGTTSSSNSNVVVQGSNNANVIQPPTSGQVFASTVQSEQDESLSSSTLYLSLMILLNVLAIAGIAYLLISLSKK